MDTVPDIFARGVQQLLGRASGPLHLRLLIMPTVVTFLAVRAGLRDAREGRPAFLWTLLTRRGQRLPLLHSALRDIGRVMIMAAVLDTAYQLTVLRAIHVPQLLIVVLVLAVLPYIVVRGPVTRLARWRYRNQGVRFPQGRGVP